VSTTQLESLDRADGFAQRPRVCALVINSVSHDARVLKEADSLAEAGYAVTIVGIRDARNALPEETRPSGVKIVRVAWRAAAYRRFSLVVAAVAVLAVLAMIALSFVLPYQRVEVVFDFLAERYFLPLIVYAVAAFGLIYGIRRFRALRLTSRRYRAIEEQEPGPVSEGGLRSQLTARLAHHYRTFNWMRPIVEAVVAERPDVVHCHDIYTLPIGAKLKRRLRCPLIYDAHEIYEAVAQNKAEVGAIHRSTQRRHAAAVDGFVTINESIADFYSEHYQLPPPVVVKNATLPAGTIEYDGRLHTAAGLPPDQRIVLYQGGFAVKRGLQTLVASAAHLPADWTLVMMGWGNLEDVLRTSAERLDAASRDLPPVVFVPPAPQEELALWTAGGTLGVIPYENVGLNHWFCTPNKLWEYPNAGVPMLVSPFPELRRVVEDHGVGWLLPDPVDETALASAISRITDDDLALAEQRCHEFIAEDNWYRYADRLQALYASLAPAGAGRPGGS
jgi:glycosyltransferase involved in cell wall biosynthesis